MKALTQLFALLVWASGVVLAKGFWSTLFAVFIAPWAWYLCVERCLMVLGWLQ